MTAGAIPHWTPDGVLPPIDTSNPTSSERSPYVVSLSDFVLRFGSSPERARILDGLLRYRAVLHGAGLVEGFQWLDGSFAEDVEARVGRPPNDVDVVTFYRRPSGVSQRDLAGPLAPLLGETSKTTFHVDGYFADLTQDASKLVRTTTYWYSMWSHRRDEHWKGFVQVDLSPREDADASLALESMTLMDGGLP